MKQGAASAAKPRIYHFPLEGGRVEAVCHGVGHGIGLSQYGAEKLAEEGYGAEAILGYYFKNVEVISLDRV